MIATYRLVLVGLALLPALAAHSRRPYPPGKEYEALHVRHHSRSIGRPSAVTRRQAPLHIERELARAEDEYGRLAAEHGRLGRHDRRRRRRQQPAL